MLQDGGVATNDNSDKEFVLALRQIAQPFFVYAFGVSPKIRGCARNFWWDRRLSFLAR